MAPTLREKTDFYLESRRRHRKYDLQRLTQKASRMPTAVQQTEELRSRNVLIVGWYGTETVGDKAILWEIVKELQSRSSPPQKITVSSLHPFVTRYTIRELSLDGVGYVETYSKEFEGCCKQCDEVVVGGGPLMSLEALNHMLYAMIENTNRGGLNRIAGCGIGPLEGTRFTEAVSEMLRLSGSVKLRDSKSAERSQSEFNIQAEVVPDPATGFVLANRDAARTFNKSCTDLDGDFDVAFFLRELTGEYTGDLKEDEVKARMQHVEDAQFELIKWLSQNGYRVRLFAMHTFTIGCDDRVLNRRLVRQFQQYDPSLAHLVTFARLPMSPLEILTAMAKARFTVAMRFHSVLFAYHMSVPFLAIDYTSGGKIKSFLDDHGATDKLFSLDDLIAGKPSAIIVQKMSEISADSN
ncbi:MAG: polysaccharide pyruvyl transferase family protein [Planctomycetaceae bacterium]